MSKLTILKDMLAKDTFFCSLFHKAVDIQEAMTVASPYGLSLSVEEVTAYRGNLPRQKMLGTHAVEKPVARFPAGSPAPGFWDGGFVNGFSDFGGGCSDVVDGCSH